MIGKVEGLGSKAQRNCRERAKRVRVEFAADKAYKIMIPLRPEVF
jgi:hypothetical protein